ncbi:MAG: hypothetical protein QOG80_101 [Pseudonocardiales bacterium]|jgi:uncharacterized protein (TIGR02611 family)|nr:hypothetical protein [Pseudonocardiales bacterium]
MTGRVDTQPPELADTVAARGGIRARVRALPGGRLIWRIAVTIAGAAVIAVGIVLLPLPGPGWLIIFAGLGVLATEYTWAARLLRWMRTQVARWTRWIASQSTLIRIALVVLSLLFLATIAVGAWYLYRVL